MVWDLWLSILLLAITLLVLVTAARSRRARALLAASGVVACAAVVWAELEYRRPRESAPTPPRPREVEEDGFVSSNACRSCHPSEYESWDTSFHSRMTRVATPDSVVEGFDGRVFDWRGEHWELSRRGDRYFVEHGVGKQREENEVVMTTGSHHFQAFWYATGAGSMVDVVPLGYRYSENTWIPLDCAFVLPPGLRQKTEGRWNTTCNRCHSTHPRPRPAGKGFDTLVAELGIACESCHGPAGDHVARHENPVERYSARWSEDDDPSLVDPTDLPSRRASEVCGQCHSLNSFYSQADLAFFAEHGFPFRPGDELTETRKIETTSADHFWPDGMIRVSGREYNGLIRSPCYTHDGDDARVLSCLSCHEMHPSEDSTRSLAEWADDQLAPGMDGDTACVQCHEQYADPARAAAHSHHATGSTGSSCYDCHMPHTSYGLLKAIRAHEVASPDVSVTLATGRPNACNLCHLDRTLQWTAEHLHAWYGQPAPESLREGKGLDEDEQTVAASILELLRGDAGLRALIAWHYAWKPARDVSGSAWQAPYLGELLADPYDAVRFIAARSLRTLPGFDDFAYDFLAPPAERRQAVDRVRIAWKLSHGQLASGELLVGPDGDLLRPSLQRLLAERDDRPVILSE
jgi:hypothetical protein